GDFVQVDAGYYFTCAPRDDGAVECWGRNASGQAMSEQRILFTSTPPDPGFTGTKYKVQAEGGGSGKTIVVSTLTPEVCSVSGKTVTLLAAGTCTVAADQAGAARYFPAPRVTQSFAVVVGSPPTGPANAVAQVLTNGD